MCAWAAPPPFSARRSPMIRTLRGSVETSGCVKLIAGLPSPPPPCDRRLCGLLLVISMHRYRGVKHLDLVFDWFSVYYSWIGRFLCRPSASVRLGRMRRALRDRLMEIGKVRAADRSSAGLVQETTARLREMILQRDPNTLLGSLTELVKTLGVGT